MASADQGDKQYDPTPHKREEARKKGQIARSREAGGAAATAALLGVVAGERESLVIAVRRLFSASIGQLDSVATLGVGTPLRVAVGALATMALPAAAAAAAAACAVGLAQSRFAFRMELVGFDPERLDPIPRLRQMLSPKNALVETALSLLRVGSIACVAYLVTRKELPDLLNMASMPLGTSATQLGASGGRVIGALVLALGVVAAVEYAASWYRLERELRMTRQELTDEMKQQDGDPKVKQRMRSRARTLAKKRSIQSVKEATVVVTNPTHVAVALRYGPQDAAPVVVSKGHDAVALRIRAEARKHGIPILENRPLARALDAEVEIGQFVPSAHFAAVARILAFVYRLKAPRTAHTN